LTLQFGVLTDSDLGHLEAWASRVRQHNKLLRADRDPGRVTVVTVTVTVGLPRQQHSGDRAEQAILLSRHGGIISNHYRNYYSS
jgi:hypothetical protein